MKRTAATALTALVLAAALTACSSDDSTDAAPKKKPTTAPGASSTEDMAGAEASAGIPPKPDAAVRLAYIRALTGIDPDIVHGKEAKAVDRGRNQCQTIHDFPKDTLKQASMAEKRFTSPHHPQGFGKAKAALIVVAVHTNLCPKF
ncbi:hypothetical protein ACFXPQ_33120 [Streptomyces lydicus]|uniref:hypothetical protein n=1 Tax=Streptomyces lydicus TaxID=47763 RepID=UPI0036CEBCAC